jgi:hypothetical protein
MFIRLWGTGHELLLIIMQFLRLTQLSACLEAPSWWPDDDWYVSEASKKIMSSFYTSLCMCPQLELLQRMVFSVHAIVPNYRKSNDAIFFTKESSKIF